MTLSGGVNALATRVAQEFKTLRASQVKSFSTTLATSATSYVITHNLGTRDVQVQYYLTGTPYRQEWATIDHTTINTITIQFATAPTAGSVRVVIHGKAD